MKSSRIAMAAASGLVALSITAAPAFAAPGNNGTLKVHEFGTPSGTESNDPHVCKFNFEAFNLDATKQGGLVTITPQAPTKTGPTKTVAMPVADANGYSQTAYVSLPNGHYKAELDNKFATDAGVKAKSKVFWVECEETSTPAVPTTEAPKPSTSTPAVPTTEAPKPSTTTPAVPTTEAPKPSTTAPAVPTTEAPKPSTATATSTMGPKVQTDYTGKSSNSFVTLGLALGATALVAGGVVAARRRNG